MSDIVERLRNWRTVHLARLHLLMEEAADEIERLRGLLSRTGSDSRQTCDKATECRSQNEKTPERERLTEAERGPVAWAVAIGNEGLVLDGIFLRKRDADEACAWRNEHTAYGARLIPLYRHTQPAITDAEREAINMSRKILVSDPSMNPAQRAEWAITLSRLLDRTGFAQ